VTAKQNETWEGMEGMTLVINKHVINNMVINKNLFLEAAVPDEPFENGNDLSLSGIAGFDQHVK
jgi:hypothetical protein